MDPLVVVAVVAIWLLVWTFAARQVGKGRHRFVWVFFAPTMAILVYWVWVAVRSWAEQPLVAVVLGLIAVPSLLLFTRMARQRSSEVPISDPTWKLSPAHFDYIVWVAIGVPLVLVIGLIALLIASALGAVN